MNALAPARPGAARRPSRRSAGRLFVLAAVLFASDPAHAACPKSRASGARQPGRPPVVIDIPADDEREASCPSRPRSDCEVARAGRLAVRDLSGEDDDRIVWRWNGAAPLEEADIGDPALGTTFGVCVYDSHEGAAFLITSLRVPPGRNWRRDSRGGWRYSATRNGPGGVTAMRLKNGASGRATLRIAASGQRAPVPQRASRAKFFHQDREVVVQLVSSSNSACRSSAYRVARTNSADAFAAIQPARPADATARGR